MNALLILAVLLLLVVGNIEIILAGAFIMACVPFVDYVGHRKDKK